MIRRSFLRLLVSLAALPLFGTRSRVKVTPAEPFTGTITFYDEQPCRDLVFTPPSLTWHGSSEAKWFTYTPRKISRPVVR